MWNIGTLSGEGMELMDTMTRRRLIKGKSKKTENAGYILWFTENKNIENGEGIIVVKS